MHISEIIKERKEKKSTHKTEQDEILSEHIDLINLLRKQAGFKPITKKYLAIKINQHPQLKKTENGELRLLLADCQKKGNYSKFFWVLPK